MLGSYQLESLVGVYKNYRIIKLQHLSFVSPSS
jgi:hypothetical protein